MESLPASRKIFLGCVYPGPLLYNNVVYGCPSTSDILLSEPEAKKRRGGGRRRGRGRARDRLINHKCVVTIVVQRCCATYDFEKGEFWGNDRYFSSKMGITVAKERGEQWDILSFHSGGEIVFNDLVYLRVMDKAQF